MSKLHVNHLKAKLTELYSDKIDISDARSEDDKENFFLTRAYASYTLQILAQIDAITASSAIVDGFDDNGIDAIYFDRRNKELWLVQSKWIKSGSGEPDTGETSRFKNGVTDLIDLRFDRFNAKVKGKEAEVIEALEDPLVKIKIVLTYTGQDTFSEHNRRVIDDLLAELNDPSELAIFNRFSLKQAHKSLVGILDGQPIKADLALSNWGKVEEPYSAIYGTINGNDLAQLWSENRGRLFSDNIRDFIGFSEVNEDIRETALNEPENFYFYNNGITALCQSLHKKPVGGGDRAVGIFVANDLKIVNGAQTVGSIGNAYEINPEQIGKLNVFIKIISLENCPPEFGLNVTKKTNTQNRIDKKDFVSLDPEQDRLKTELALERIVYHLKRSDGVIKQDESNCYVEEVITALACAKPDINLAVQAKREVGKLWEDISKQPYTDIINTAVTATQAWRAVKIMREVTNKLKLKEQAASGREKSCYIHCNRFVLNIVFSNIGQQVLRDPNFDFDAYFDSTLPTIIDQVTEQTKTKMEELFPTSLVHQVFRNFTKCRTLKGLLN
ncbi:AIPR family protein [Dyadobacter chenhuakuii]|uniref:AIPR family protein n=1 Tax=Dyadobacter chenhuakuii TaxID=2909339 RepID=A0ABY4XHE3_9BACT|nr:AIPR family protein [Dyadobacter chenhuakuii]MCF2495772.1 AIPR family protein [Dyadobacter chenhuakuii]USJ29803.1 AIPR family protein [Dyadobacter chenhuakuii]